ncbi:hypothetical protein M501DRAFT_918275, partial [Patellaria atrata CBS 101060]
ASSDEDEINFPTYEDDEFNTHHEMPDDPPPSPKTDNSSTLPSSSDENTTTTATSTPDLHPTAEDDTAIKREPSRHVDYLSHNWREEDLWSSWKHIVSKRKIYGERSRLENASWRSWAKSKYQLKTVSPETLNWLKDYDLTWLYGPLQTANTSSFSQQASEPASNISKSNSFLNKKPILKKRSMSELMLQRSISTSSLVKQAAASVQAQQYRNPDRPPNRPGFARAQSDFGSSAMPSRTISRDPTETFSSRTTSGIQTPNDQGERKHIRFDNKVEQCIAVDVKGDDDDELENGWGMHNNDDDDSSDDGVVMMKRSKKKKTPLKRNISRSSFNSESKTIAKLPDTTLKYRTDSPDIPDHAQSHSTGFWRSSRLSPSPSQETLRPSHPSSNFLLGEEDDDAEMGWEPSGAFVGRKDSAAVGLDGQLDGSLDSKSHEGSGALRRTASGMFMPYEEDEDEAVSSGLLGKVVDTVNTARDIAHVIWNVGW